MSWSLFKVRRQFSTLTDSEVESIVKRIRSQFAAEYAENSELYYEEDANRVQNDDWTVERYLIMCHYKESSAYNMVRDAMKWRKEYGVVDMKASDFPREFFTVGEFHSYVQDKNGYRQIILIGHKHKRFSAWSDLFQRFMAFQMEQSEKYCREHKLPPQQTGIYNLLGSNLSNVDLGLVAFGVKLISSYYPMYVQQIYLFEVAWILKAIMNLIISWMPQVYKDVVSFANAEQLQEIVGINNLPDHITGTCPEAYDAAPEGCLSIYDFVKKHNMKKENADDFMAHYGQFIRTNNNNNNNANN